MDLGLRDKRAAVAAATAGLGFATAKALTDEGARVVICGRQQDRVDAAADALGQAAVGVVADVATTVGAKGFVERAIGHLGGLDILVANAGGPPGGSATTTSVDSYRSAIELNLLSTVAMALGAAPTMREQGWGRILAITSIGVRQPIPFLAASVTARAGLTGFLKTLATEIASDGVTVNSIQPGSHLTDRLRSLTPDQYDTLLAEIPTGELGNPADFAAAAAFLCSTPARFITGTSLLIDGGASKGLL